ncbi:Vacuolar protein sorting-associated protein 13 [Neolecta irregularis DAH-3]|uniref:Vacuolar protein sorting-associated protein 13 n=1 Tax=Neolecta irregularis (strain DAH-3) TaxID=1198029 RepID=A0A1U7LIB7_NEOID|nr:Vacuolar protein sorting-associated protein 13 [Neolecta irregularis DAH-3]|eukprot:OLL22292.1 Vacuolar protein sorting-associated protein 13 [Neolecta irregularis DAH-3]
MLESLVAGLLNRFLGAYVKNFDPKQLNIGIWSGAVKLRNLELKKEALDKFRLPIDVSQGYLGELTIEIPWSNLKNKPVKVFIENVYLLASPKAEQEVAIPCDPYANFEYDEEDEGRRAQAVKQEKLDNAELLSQQSSIGLSEQDVRNNQSFTDTLVAKIVDNLQVSVKCIHIRYEDKLSGPSHPFAVGITLSEFSATSTDANWNPVFVHDNVEMVHKLITLGSLAVYWNSDTQSLAGKPADELQDLFSQLVSRGDHIPESNQFILKPVSGTGRLELSKIVKKDTPNNKTTLLFDEIGFVLDEDQYRDALLMLDLFHFYIRHQHYQKYRPKGVSVTENPHAWFHFAAHCILREIHEKNRKWTWEYFQERRDQRTRYIELFKKKVMETLVSPETTELQEMEKVLSYEDIRFYRSLARNRLRKERALTKSIDPVAKQGWGSWLMSSITQQSQQTTPNEEGETVITEAQKQELYDAIDWDERQTSASVVDETRDSIKLAVSAELKQGSLTLRKDPHGKCTNIISVLFDTFRANVLQRADSMKGELSLGGLRVYDGTTEGTLFRQIVQVKDKEHVDVEAAETRDITNQQNEVEAVVAVPDAEEPFFYFSFEQNPLDESADSAVSARLRSMEIIYNPRCIESIYRFFEPPESQMESLGVLIEAAGATVEGIRNQTRAGLEFALEEHKTLNAKLDLQAPLIIIPESVTKKDACCIVLDAGHISLFSDLVDKNKIREIQAKHSHQYTPEDYSRLESLMYDKFTLQLESTQLLIGPSVESTLNQLKRMTDDRPYNVVDRINMTFQVEMSILPKAPNLTKFRITGHLPLLHASISDSKYKTMMRIIDIAMPNFDIDEKNTPIEQFQSDKKDERPSTARTRSARAGSFYNTGHDDDLFRHELDSLPGEQSDRENNDNELFVEARSEMENEDNIQQNIFEFKFTVDKLQGSLFKAHPKGEKPDDLLVELVLERFALNFVQRKYGMVAEVALWSLHVEDRIDPTSALEFKRIISSARAADKEQTQELIRVKYTSVQNDSPDFMEVYEGIQQNIDVHISTINVIVTRRSILTLYDYIILTFISPQQDNAKSQPSHPKHPPRSSLLEVEGASPADFQRHQDNQPVDDSKLRAKIVLSSIVLVLNNDGIKLATLTLKHADLGIFMMGNTMRVGARLGDLSISDDIDQGAQRASPFRQLISLEGGELADFRYEVYDPKNSSTYPQYDSSVYLRTGSLKVSFVEEPFRKIFEFMTKFARMKAIYDTAREVALNQASNIQETASRMHFDIVIRTPIVIFPRMDIREIKSRQIIKAELGEIFAHNSFELLSKSKGSLVSNHIKAGLRKIGLSSQIVFEDGQVENLSMMDDVTLQFDVVYAEHQSGLERADLEIEGFLSDLKMKLTQTQARFLMELGQSIPRVFQVEPTLELKEAPEDLRANQESNNTDIQREKDQADNNNQEVNVDIVSPVTLKEDKADIWDTLGLSFKIDTIALEIFNNQEGLAVKDIEDHSLSKFSLNNTNVNVRMSSDGASESGLTIKSFTISDTRKHQNNQFREVIPAIKHNGSQFTANVTISGGEERSMIAMLAADSPQLIFALDHLFAMRDFAYSAFPAEEITDEIYSDLSPAETASYVCSNGESTSELAAERSNAVSFNRSEVGRPESPAQTGVTMTMAYRLNINNASVILIADPTSPTSEAIVLNAKAFVISQQTVMTVTAQEIGMYLCKMDKLDGTRIRVLDDFDINLSMESRSDSLKGEFTSIAIDVNPLVVRLSFHDIKLVTAIINRAYELSGDTQNGQSSKTNYSIYNDKERQSLQIKHRTASGHALSPVTKPTRKALLTMHDDRHPSLEKPATVAVKRIEKLRATFDGLRLVLIGDMHELPFLDLNVSQFSADVKDWSSEMKVDTKMSTYINAYNFSNSHWEPLAEKWDFRVHMNHDSKLDKFSVRVSSPKRLELTVTSKTIATAMTVMNYISQKPDDVLSKTRETDAPYKIRNRTGYPMQVWTSVSKHDDIPKHVKHLADGEDVPWQFEDWWKLRESAADKDRGTDNDVNGIGIKIERSEWLNISNIPVDREGEVMYSLRSKRQQTSHRLLCEVKLGTDNVKVITLRSSFLVENRTSIPVEMAIMNEKTVVHVYKIAPDEDRPVPIQAAFEKSIRIKPDSGFGYTWCGEGMFWKDLMANPTRSIACPANERDESPYWFQLHTRYDKGNPLTKVYPYMTLRISAPIMIKNLLPVDMKFRIYDKNSRKNWSMFLRKGGQQPIHVVELSHLLLMSIDLEDDIYKPSDFSIINTRNPEDYGREKKIVLEDQNGLKLPLRLHYRDLPDSGMAFEVSVYSPYVILNMTGLDMQIKSKSFLSSAKVAAGQLNAGNKGEAKPYMFAYSNDERRNRAVLKFADSEWSKPQSFEAIGSVAEAILPSSTNESEFHIGICVDEGEGKYKMTKVVTLTPRFILNSILDEDLNIREPGSSIVRTLKAHTRFPLHFLRQTQEKQMVMCFPGLGNEWHVSPIAGCDVGRVHVKMSKGNERQQLVKIEIMLEKAVVFIHIGVENSWPYSIRNESDTDFVFWQAHPVNIQNDDRESPQSRRRSLHTSKTYSLPARSVMPYAWDYPATQNKELIISANGKERHVKLAEIGNLIPMKLSMPGAKPKVIEINVVADGPTQTLVLSNYKQSKSIYRPVKKELDAGSATYRGTVIDREAFDVISLDAKTTFEVLLNFEGIGISLINNRLQELAYLTLRGLEIKYSDSTIYQTVETIVKWIQIDNQLYGGLYPIILYPTVIPKSGKEAEAHPAFHTQITMVKDDSHGVVYVKYATLLLQELSVEIDEDFLFALLDFIKIPGDNWSEQNEGKLCDDRLEIPEPQTETSGLDVYFEVLHLQPAQMNLSFVRTERINVEDKTSSRNPFAFFLNVLTMAIGNINDAPVKLNALLMENVRMSLPLLIQRIQSHYGQEFFYQLHKILGSADFLGNPVGLFNNVSSGVADIFYEPYQGFVMSDSPQELGKGLAKGAASFVKKTVFGITDSVTKVTGSISKGLSTATMDKEYQAKRRISRVRNRPRHALYGVTAGATSFATSIASGFEGLAKQPLEGAEKDGAAGFFRGVGKGLVGFATKPVVGVFDLASNLTEGIRNTTTVFDRDGIDRIRLPRYIGKDAIVRPYNHREALGQYWLKQLDKGRFIGSDEQYLAHLELPGNDKIMMLTYSRIMLIKSKRLTIEWEVAFKELQTISLEKTGIALVLRGGLQGPFVPIDTEISRLYLYRKIGLAVNEYNSEHRPYTA